MIAREYNYHVSGHYSSTYLLFNTRHFGDWFPFPSSGGTYSEGPNRKRSFPTPDISNYTNEAYKANTEQTTNVVLLNTYLSVPGRFSSR
jgi:hypothetical protein